MQRCSDAGASDAGAACEEAYCPQSRSRSGLARFEASKLRPRDRAASQGKKPAVEAAVLYSERLRTRGGLSDLPVQALRRVVLSSAAVERAHGTLERRDRAPA